MKSATSFLAGFITLGIVGWVLRGFAAILAPELDEASMEAAATHLGFDCIAAVIAGAVASYCSPTSAGASMFAYLLFMFLFLAAFLIADGPTVWLKLARLPLLPGATLLGGRLYRNARHLR